MAGIHHACRLQAKDVLPKFVVTKCKFLTGCNHCHIKFKFDRSICNIFPVGALMMHIINIVIMQESSLQVYSMYSLYNTYISTFSPNAEHFNSYSNITMTSYSRELRHKEGNCWWYAVSCLGGVLCHVRRDVVADEIVIWMMWQFGRVPWAEDHPDRHWITSCTVYSVHVCVAKRQVVQNGLPSTVHIHVNSEDNYTKCNGIN